MPAAQGPAAGDLKLAARALVALGLANVRYWSTVAPEVRKQLRYWERRAQTIPDPELRELALAKLHGEGFNAEAAAMLATLAPRAQRKRVVEAIVALELLFDYLDGLTERPFEDPLGEGKRLFRPYLDAVDPGGRSESADPHDPQLQGADSYLQELSSAVKVALAQMPAIWAVAEAAGRAAARSAEAQIRMHSAKSIGTAQRDDWAGGEAQATALPWREFLAGAASSVLAVHALIAAAADPSTTQAEAEAIDDAYLSICVVVTLLDGLVDQIHDSSSSEPSYFSLYNSDATRAQALTRVATRALHQAQALRHGAHHVVTLTGAIAYYASTPGAGSELAKPVIAQLTEALGPLVGPPLLMTRSWRAAKRLRSMWQ